MTHRHNTKSHLTHHRISIHLKREINQQDDENYHRYGSHFGRTNTRKLLHIYRYKYLETLILLQEQNERFRRD